MFTIIFSNYDLAKFKRTKPLRRESDNPEICSIPQLNYNLPLEKLILSPECTSRLNWGTIDALKHKWRLNEQIQSEINSINCSYRKVERIDDFKIKLGKYSNLKDEQVILDDVVEVECVGTNKTNNSTANFNNLYVQVVDIEPMIRYEIKKDENGCFPYNVMLLSYDSVSRVSFTRRLKKTFDLIKKTDNFYVLEGYNIVGDGTPQG